MIKRLIPVIIAIVLIIVVLVVGFGREFMERYSYSDARAELMPYFGLTDTTEVAIILQDTILEEKARLFDGTYYFDLATVHKYFNPRFYEDKTEGLLLYTLPEDIVRTQIGTEAVIRKAGSAGGDSAANDGPEAENSAAGTTDGEAEDGSAAGNVAEADDDAEGDAAAGDGAGNDTEGADAAGDGIETDAEDGDVSGEGIEAGSDAGGVVGEAASEMLGYVIARYEGDVLYVAVDFVKEYTNFSWESFENPGRMQVFTEWGDIKTAKVNKDTAVRIRGGIKSEILTDVAEGDKLTVLEQMETWAEVKTADGFIGYVENKRLTDVFSERLIPLNDYQEPVYQSLVREHKISMGWHLIGGPEGNSTLYEMAGAAKGLNVISPTWFILNDNAGNYTSFASPDYVEAAHDMGLEVWALVENTTNTPDMNELLSASSRRWGLIDKLIAESVSLKLDGINVDFEAIPAEAGAHFIQFIRELSVSCRAQGLVLSVDNYVPYQFNDYYNRREQGVFADYVVIMGYDEHYAGSSVAGSVASIDYVENGIVKTVEQVPAEKVINAVPFYTRIWETKGAEVSSQAVGMVMADEWVANHQLERTWDDVTCQNYCEYTADGSKFQAWLEDVESLRVKLSVMEVQNLGGVAFWRLGMEKAEIWDMMAEYLD